MMDCQSVMRPIKTSLYDDHPTGAALDFMVEKHMGLVPVVDRDDKFVGLLSGDRLMHFMLPKTITMMRGAKRASYLRESREELQERLAAVRQKPVAELMDRRVTTVFPETPLIEALTLLSDKQFVVPVIDHDGVLVGAISFFSVQHALEDVEQ